MQITNYKLDLPAERRRYTDRDEFVVLTLWLAGFSVLTIARGYGFRRGQVAGIVHRSEFAARSSMSDRERQSELNLLHGIRIDDDSGVALDGGKLRNFDWRVRPLVGRQVRTSRRAI